jgi:hypothetical protein
MLYLNTVASVRCPVKEIILVPSSCYLYLGGPDFAQITRF